MTLIVFQLLYEDNFKLLIQLKIVDVSKTKNDITFLKRK